MSQHHATEFMRIMSEQRTRRERAVQLGVSVSGSLRGGGPPMPMFASLEPASAAVAGGAPEGNMPLDRRAILERPTERRDGRQPLSVGAPEGVARFLEPGRPAEHPGLEASERERALQAQIAELQAQNASLTQRAEAPPAAPTVSAVPAFGRLGADQRQALADTIGAEAMARHGQLEDNAFSTMGQPSAVDGMRGPPAPPQPPAPAPGAADLAALMVQEFENTMAQMDAILKTGNLDDAGRGERMRQLQGTMGPVPVVPGPPPPRLPRVRPPAFRTGSERGLEAPAPAAAPAPAPAAAAVAAAVAAADMFESASMTDLYTGMPMSAVTPGPMMGRSYQQMHGGGGGGGGGGGALAPMPTNRPLDAARGAAGMGMGSVSGEGGMGNKLMAAHRQGWSDRYAQMTTDIHQMAGNLALPEPEHNTHSRKGQPQWPGLAEDPALQWGAPRETPTPHLDAAILSSSDVAAAAAADVAGEPMPRPARGGGTRPEHVAAFSDMGVIRQSRDAAVRESVLDLSNFNAAPNVDTNQFGAEMAAHDAEVQAAAKLSAASTDEAAGMRSNLASRLDEMQSMVQKLNVAAGDEMQRQTFDQGISDVISRLPHPAEHLAVAGTTVAIMAEEEGGGE